METTEKYNHEASFSRSFGNGWNVFGDQFLVLFLITIILCIIDAPSHMSNMVNFRFDPTHTFTDFGGEHMHWFVGWWAALGALVILFGLIALAYSFLLVPVFDYGSSMMFVQAARKQRPDIATLVSGFKENYFHIVLGQSPYNRPRVNRIFCANSARYHHRMQAYVCLLPGNGQKT